MLIKGVDQAKNTMTGLHEKLISYELFEKFHPDYKVCLFNSEKCEKMKKGLQ